MTTQETGYNGWTNYETWNVALWIGNDEGLYQFARGFRRHSDPFARMKEGLAELGGDIATHTPDGVAWNDDAVNVDEVNEMIREL